MARAPKFQRRDHTADPINTVVGSGGAYHRRNARNMAVLAGQLSGLQNQIDQNEAKRAVIDAEKAGRLHGLDDQAVFQLRSGTSDADRAYNAAAKRSYFKRIELEARGSLDALQQQHAHDPAALAGAMTANRAGFISAVPDEIAPEMDMLFDTLERPYALQAQRDQQAAVQAADRADFLEQYAVRERDLSRLSFLSELDGQGDLAIAGQLDGLRELLASHGPKTAFSLGGVDYGPDAGRSGSLSPEAAAKLLISSESEARTARYEGVFSRIQGVSAQQDFIKQFAADFKAGTGSAKNLSADEYDKLITGFKSGVTRNQTGNRKAVAALKREIRDADAVLSGGFVPGPGVLAGLRGKAYASGDPDVIADYEDLETQNQVMSSARLSTPADLEAWQATAGAQMQDGATRAQVDVFKSVGRLQSRMQTALAKDPIGWARDVGLVDAPPLDLEGENLVGQIAERRDIARAVAGYYNSETKFLTEGERQAFKINAEAGGDALLQTVNDLAEGFGTDAPAAFREISDDAPVLAHLGGLIQAGAAPGVLKDTAEGVLLRQGDKFQSRLPRVQARRAAEIEELGEAFAALPGAQASVLDTGRAMYEARAQRGGIYPDPNSDKGDDVDLYRRSIQEAMGAQFSGKKKFGGTSEIRNRSVIAPSFIEARRFQRVVRNLENAHWAAGGVYGPPVDGSGRPLSAKDLNRSWLVSVGHGRYRVSLTDPYGDDPQYAAAVDAPGGVYEIDFNAIEDDLRQTKLRKYMIGSR